MRSRPFRERGSKRDDVRPNLRTMGYAKSVTIAFSVNATTEAVAIHGVFYGGQDFETLLRDAARSTWRHCKITMCREAACR